MINILYQDRRILVCLKPYGIVSTDEPGGLPEQLRIQTGTDCFRTVHRLDQVVGGVMVLARSREAARRLSTQVASRQFQKEYLAIVHGTPPESSGVLQDFLARDPISRKTYVATEPGRDVREAVLDYRLLAQQKGQSLLHITLHTGRTHQIRAQFASRDLPLVGDRKYGAPVNSTDNTDGIALWSYRLHFQHPQTEELLTFSAPPPMYGAWNTFHYIWKEGTTA